MEPSQQASGSRFLVPASIVAAGLIVAGSFFYSAQLKQQNPEGTTETAQVAGGGVDVRAPSLDDHIIGNPNAPIVFIEYSDFECPFCSRYHRTMKLLMDKYGKDGTVAWVYRHFPIEELHKKSWREAIASECAAELGGNEAFWAYADLIFENTPGRDGLDLTLLSDFAEQVGLDREAFNACMQSERTRPKVQEDYDEASTKTTAEGTPHTIVIAGDQRSAIAGALQFNALDAIVQTILNQGLHNLPVE